MRYCLSDTGFMPFDLVLLSGGCLLDQCVVFRQTERRPGGCGNDGRGANPSCLHPCRQAAGALALRDSARWVYLGAPLAVSGPRETLATRQEKPFGDPESVSVIKTRAGGLPFLTEPGQERNPKIREAFSTLSHSYFCQVTSSCHD